MATLPTLYPTSDVQVGTWTTDAGGTTNLWQKIEEGVATATDTNDFIRAPTGTTNTTANQYEAGFTDTPSDFLSMTALSVNVRYNQTGRSDDTLSLVIRIESSGGTAYTNDVTISTITTTTFTNSLTAFTLTSAGLAATKTDWDSAYIALAQTYNASMANDNARVQVSAIELTGDYASGATVSPATISTSVTLPAVSLSAGSTLTPATISTTATLPAPTIGIGAEVPVATTVTTVTMPAAETTIGAIFSVATISTSATFPAVSLSAGSTPAPSTVSVTTTLPQATTTFLLAHQEPTLSVPAIGTFAFGLAKPTTLIHGGWGTQTTVQ